MGGILLPVARGKGPARVNSSRRAQAQTNTDVGAVAGPASNTPADILADPAGVSFTAPTPPSANHLFKNVRGVGRVKSEHYDDFLRRTLVMIRGQRVPHVAGNVIVIIGVERMSGNADIDNRLKALLDAIVKAGVIEDDRFITALSISWLPKANGLSHITILPVAETGLKFHPSHNGASGAWIIDAPSTEDDSHGYFIEQFEDCAG